MSICFTLNNRGRYIYVCLFLRLCLCGSVPIKLQWDVLWALPALKIILKSDSLSYRVPTCTIVEQGPLLANQWYNTRVLFSPLQ